MTVNLSTQKHADKLSGSLSVTPIFLNISNPLAQVILLCSHVSHILIHVNVQDLKGIQNFSEISESTSLNSMESKKEDMWRQTKITKDRPKDQ